MSPDTVDTGLFEEAACGLLRTRVDGRFIRVNATFAEWVGHTQASLVAGRRLQDLLTMGGRIFHQTHWSPLLSIQRSISEVKLDVVRADGEMIPVVFNAIRRERDGELVDDVAAFIARDRDMYERELLRSRKRLEELVAETQRLQERESARAVFAERMVGIVSHDLRNPLNAILLSATTLASSEGLDALAAKIVLRIQSSADRAARMISDLLDFTQARLGGGIRITRRPVDLHEIIRGVLDEIEAAHPGRAIRTRLDGNGHGEWDSDRIAQVVQNVVTNALKYSPQDTVVQLVTATERGWVSFSVHNRGAPIPAERMPSLFEPLLRGTAEVDRTGRSIGETTRLDAVSTRSQILGCRPAGACSAKIHVALAREARAVNNLSSLFSSRQHLTAILNFKPIRHRLEWLGWRPVAALKLSQRLNIDFPNYAVVGDATLDPQ